MVPSDELFHGLVWSIVYKCYDLLRYSSTFSSWLLSPNHSISHLIQIHPFTKTLLLASLFLLASFSNPRYTATAAAAFAPATTTGAVLNFGSKIPRRTNKVVDIVGMNPYGGLKASNSVLALSMPVSTEQCFAKVVGSLRAASNTHGRGGGHSPLNALMQVRYSGLLQSCTALFWLGLLLDLYSSELKRGLRKMSECIV
ncbi:hypothetical protein POTOM_010244 [Populus tomentosa]|uniref:Uncharacterized protein n=1 Tax=Populus tomentosa TaxID=118781 RepID=A0A8X8ADH8_POPTO|nr:hypothetical protein POTOM_010244 [Populus tomentosa]